MSERAQTATAAKRPAVSELTDFSVVHVAARRGARQALDEAARSVFGLALPPPGRMVQAGGAMIIWAGPEQWLVMQPLSGSGDASAQLAKTFNGLASVVDASDSRRIFRLKVSRPSEALVRSMGLDFADNVFRAGDVAITHMSHLGVMVWRLPDGNGYDFACARTYSRDFLDWLDTI